MLLQDRAELLGHRHALLGRVLLDRAMKRLGEVQGEALHSARRLRRRTRLPSSHRQRQAAIGVRKRSLGMSPK